MPFSFFGSESSARFVLKKKKTRRRFFASNAPDGMKAAFSGVEDCEKAISGSGRGDAYLQGS